MGLDIDAGASLATAALVAGVIESGNNGEAKAGAESVCANCATPLSGPFCHACGQRAHVHRSLLHLGEEFLHGILHFDAKAWRTLPLLVCKPGQLTRRYLDGQRTRFVSPLALFLFMMFFMFFVASYTSGKGVGKNKDIAESRAALVEKVEQEKRKLEKAKAAMAAAKGDDLKDAAEEVADRARELADQEKAVKIFDSASSMATTGKAGEGAEQEAARNADGSLMHSESLNIKSDIKFIDNAYNQAMKNPDLTIYKLKGAAAKYTFLLVPISLPFLWLMFWRRRDVTMYDHAVFTLYSLSFMAVLFSTAFLLKFAGLKLLVVWMLFLLPPLHMFSQLRGTYKLGVASALWRTVFLLFSATLVFLLYLALVLVLAVQ